MDEKPQYADMFSRLKSIGFHGDNASNGIFLPGSRALAGKAGLPGHWTNSNNGEGSVDGGKVCFQCCYGRAVMSEVLFFAIEYASGEAGCPPYLSGEFNQTAWEWAPYEQNPESLTINNNYVFSVFDKNIDSADFDFYGLDDYYVSSKFIDICNQLGVRFRPIPMEIIFSENRKALKDYFIFLPAENYALLDTEKSEFKIDLDLATGKPLINGVFGDSYVYSWIKKFVPVDGVGHHLFRCKETMDLFCSRRFKEAAESNDLRGLRFVPIDQHYRYDPWGEIQ